MVKPVINSRAIRMFSIGQLTIISLLAAVPVIWAMEEGAVKEKAKCQFSMYLEDPDNRARYVTTLAKARAAYAQQKGYDNAATYGVMVKAKFNGGSTEMLDSFSAGCLSCHDGNTASKVRPNFVNNPGKKSLMQAISGKHPIGMDYQQYSVASDRLKSLDEMSMNLTLVEGRVSCITCHDPLNSEKSHQRITSAGVDLCSACHNV